MKPILFNTEMVRANLEGRKTVTRRLLKPQPTFSEHYEGIVPRPERCDDGSWCFAMDPFAMICEGRFRPPYEEGEILYVRESWSMTPDILLETTGPVYMADFTDSELDCLKAKHFRWKPSIHMPKEAARLFLRVTYVRLERLQDIDEEGAKAEGANFCNGKHVGVKEKMRRSAVERFADIWDSTIKPADLPIYGWNANPWVWVIEYERCEKPEGA